MSSKEWTRNMYLYFFVCHDNMSFFLQKGRFRLPVMSGQLVSGSVNLTVSLFSFAIMKNSILLIRA